MNFRLLLILVFPFLLGCKKEILIFPYTKGYIYSKKEGKPIKNVAFYSPYIGDKFKNDILVKSSVSTDDNGFFFLNQWKTKINPKDTLSKTNIFYVEYNDEIRKVHVKKPITGKDTIDLGIIYFEDLENFDDEELKAK